MLYRLAEQLGQTVEWVMHNVSVFELRGWAKYFKIKADAAKRKR